MLRDGWNEREADGLWSKAGKATVVLPTSGLRHGPLRLEMMAATYVGLGFADGVQKISLRVGGREFDRREDKKGDGPKTLVAHLSATDWTPEKDISLTLDVDRTINPSQSANNPDTRDLGGYLYALTIAPEAEGRARKP